MMYSCDCRRIMHKQSFYFFFLKAVFVNFVAMEQGGDFRSRMLAFRGAGGEHPQLRLRGLTFPLIPQESRTLHSNPRQP
ncbi:hypothetical protein SAMN05443252_101506 [Bacillus sp. OV322]|nr:hypothetical protein SAMN05443252_101506 [Bacillus sp. OV322]